MISDPFFKGRAGDPDFWWQRGYGWRRAAKIIPPFYLSLLLSVLPCFWTHDWTNLDYAWKWATGVANFVQTPTTFSPFYWSLIIESQFYIVLPLLFLVCRRLDPAKTALVIFGMLFFIPLLVRQLTWPPGMNVWPDETTSATCGFLFARFPCQLDYFAYGILFAGVYVALGAVKEQLRALAAFGLAGVALMAATLVLWGRWTVEFGIRAQATRWSVEIAHFLPALAAMLMLFFIFDRTSLGSRIFSLGWLRFIGIVSYEWFLFHGPFVGWFHDHCGASHGSALAYAERTILPLVLSFGLSVLIYRYFSAPILHHVRDRLQQKS